MKSHIVLLAAFAAMISGCAHVQPTQSWPRLTERLEPGQPVAVTDAAGAQVRGRVAAVSATSLTLKVAGASRDFAAGDVRHVRRDGDSLWNGFAIGAGVGFLSAVLTDNVCTGPPTASCTGKQVPKRVTIFAVVSAAGAVIDALRRNHTSLYDSPNRVTAASFQSWFSVTRRCRSRIESGRVIREIAVSTK
ncbi:MAG: hypothetical protein ABI586_03580 [Candidatus Nanopelagicales bacterium]